eukprot:TRINITY_DN18895_c0_g3_i2.p2 TRINITY_DN18895_c0_g3~~TRINITY_DN18895_c0_g3_i2.p2  ORF type:complete len:146 (+),score=34.80 TRINITY_DN18895_c0_g3_i2:360-797(+)
MRHGKGIFTKKNDAPTRAGDNGYTYTGYWKMDQPHGRGVMKWNDTTKVRGTWKNGKVHGTATKKWPNGNRYDGEWVENIQNGQGVFFHKPTGVTYDGPWLNGMPKGKGKVTFADGTVVERTLGKDRDDFLEWSSDSDDDVTLPDL